MDLQKKVSGFPFSPGDVLLVLLGLVFLGSLLSAQGSALRFAEAFVQYLLIFCLAGGAIAVTIVLGGNAVAAVSYKRSKQAAGRMRARRGKPSREKSKK